MKRIATLIFCMLFLFCGCGEKKNVKPSLEGVSFDAKISYAGYNCQCSVKAYGGGNFSCTVKEPAVLKGTQINYNGEKVTVSFMGMDYEPPLPLPCENITDILKTVVESARNGTGLINPEGHYDITGKTGRYNYTVTVTESGLPVRIVCDEIKFTAEITNATVI